jgi:uncharacterized lipoprotein YehR (DUF1307 family)
MKVRNKIYFGVIVLILLMALSACGSSKEADQSVQEETDEETTTTAETGEPVTTEEVTEFAKETQSLLFGDIENGINFKSTGTEVTFSFENIKNFDNSLGMEFSLTDAAYEEEPVTMAILEDQTAYTFSGLTKGKEYYLEVYPTQSAASDDEYEAVQEKNRNCKLTLEQ